MLLFGTQIRPSSVSDGHVQLTSRHEVERHGTRLFKISWLLSTRERWIRKITDDSELQKPRLDVLKLLSGMFERHQLVDARTGVYMWALTWGWEGTRAALAVPRL